MLNINERQRLIRQVGDEPALLARGAAKCAAGLLILVLLALIAAGSGDEGGIDRAARANADGAIATAVPRAEAHRKQVFDERRARFESSNRVLPEEMLARVGRTAQP
jgi:hypothetical protein